MKQTSNRQVVDTLYILGAGASYCLSVVKSRKNSRNKTTTPLDKEFLSCLSEYKLASGWKKTAVELIENGWLDRDLISDHGLEEAIIKRVSQYEFLSSLHPRKTKNKCSNEDYLNNLSHLITGYLIRCRSNSSGSTKTFINSIFPLKENPDNYKNRIITFNYDTIVEKPLMERGLSKKKIYFDRIVKNKTEGIKRKTNEKFPHPLILKMHGSINWRCERRYFDQIILGKIDQNEKIVIWLSDKNTPKPNDNESPLIIPPIPNKPITQSSLFKFIWTTAFEYLHEAKKIVIVGYSCPPTDTLAKAMFTQFESKNLEEIFVVDPNATALRNYKEMIDPKLSRRIKWRYYSTFSEYIAGEVGV